MARVLDSRSDPLSCIYLFRLICDRYSWQWHKVTMKQTHVNHVISWVIVVVFEELRRYNNLSVISRLGNRKYPISEIQVARPEFKPESLPPSQELVHTKERYWKCHGDAIVARYLLSEIVIYIENCRWKNRNYCKSHTQKLFSGYIYMHISQRVYKICPSCKCMNAWFLT